MPANPLAARNQRIASVIEPLAKGSVVADLQQALSFLKFEIVEREAKSTSFGRSTRAAILAFQKQQNLPNSGRIDEVTSKRLNEELEKQGYFPAKQRPFRDRKFLHIKLNDQAGLDTEARSHIEQRLNQELKESILRQFRRPSANLEAAVRNLNLDYTKLTDKTLSTVLSEDVLPVLLDIADLEQELERHAEHGFISNQTSVTDQLLLNQDLRRHPLFRAEAISARNLALSRIAGLNDQQAEKVEGLDLDSVGIETWERLVAEGSLNPEQRDNLRHAVEFAKLSDDKFEVIEALRQDKRSKPRDLISMSKADWQAFLQRHRIEPPEGDDAESYATILDANIQKTFRTPYLMHRLVEQKKDDVLNKISLHDRLHARNEKIFDEEGVSKTLIWDDISEDQRPSVEASLQELDRFAKTYRYLGIADILNNRSLGAQEKQRAIQGKQQLLQSFYTNNPDIDLDWVAFIDTGSQFSRAFQPNWTGISEDDRPQVRRTLMAFQRTQRFTENFDETEALLTSGLDSGIAIASLSEREFANRLKLPANAIERIYRKASNHALFTGHALSIIEESTTHAHFMPEAIKEAPGSSNLQIINVLKNIDGYQDLFGNQNYCHCKHCRSIFGPAAYFVDLMDFIDQHVSRPVFVQANKVNHPLYLKNRRADLWSLVLSCKNTDTRIPYLTIVNEVLERYLQQVFNESDIYEALTEARLSFHQPFNLAFKSLILHLGHFRISLNDVYELFAMPMVDIARARLGISPEELATIILPSINDILFRYDIPESAQPLKVASIVKRSGFKREELGRLLKLDFIGGGLLYELKSESITGDLIGFEETLAVKSQADGKALTADNEFVRHFLDRLHRFRRLGRQLPWRYEELHLILLSLIEPFVIEAVKTGNTAARTAALGQALNQDTVVNFSHLKFIQDAFDLTVEELIALFDRIPQVAVDTEQKSLFVRLFGEVDSLRIEHPALNNTTTDNTVVSLDFGLLQGALRLAESQVVELILLTLTTEQIQNRVLALEPLSLLYRIAALARFMRLGPSEISRLLSYLNIPKVQRTSRIPHILRLIEFKEAINETPFSINDVLWLVTRESAGDVLARIDQTQVDAVIERLGSDESLYFTVESFLQIDGVNLQQAQDLVSVLVGNTIAWVVRVSDNELRYRIARAYGWNPDLSAITSFFVGAGDVPERAAQKAELVKQHLDRHHPYTLFVKHLTEHFIINQAYFDALQPFLTIQATNPAFIELLFDWSGTTDVADTQMLFDLMLELERVLYVLQSKLSLSQDSVSIIASRADLFGLTLPFDVQWESLRLLSIYKEFLPAATETLVDYHQTLLSWTNQGFPETSWPLLANLLKSESVVIRSLLENLEVPEVCFDALKILSKALALTKKLGLNGAALKQLTATNYAGLNTANNLVEGAIRSKYDDEKEWAEVIEPYVDKLNEIKRDALVDRILSKEFQLKFKDARELYQFFLLDVEMDGCARTSRVLQAISACQLYVHRCRMNLEESGSGGIVPHVHVQPDFIPTDEWLWRKNYRVWEANRKVFLYPENWLEPDLRDNKTPIFKQVESELLQSTITSDAIERIYRNYLREYAELAKLIIVNTIYDDNEDTYLFFARTQEKPFQYYWRKLLRNVEWTPWEKIELEIEPAIISAHKHHGKLYLFWTRVLTNNDKDQEQSSTTYIEDDQTIYLEYSFLEQNEKWATPKRMPYHNIQVINFNSDELSKDFTSIPRLEIGEDGAAKSPVMSKTNLETVDHYNKVYPYTRPDESQIRVFHNYSDKKEVISVKLEEFTNKLKKVSFNFLTWSGYSFPLFLWSDILKVSSIQQQGQVIFLSSALEGAELPGEIGYEQSLVSWISGPMVTNLFPYSLNPVLNIVHNRIGDLILTIDNQQFFIRYIGGDGYKKELNSLLEAAIAYSNRKRDTLRLSTTLAERLGEILFDQGVEKFLNLDTQRLVESPIRHIDFEWIAELPPPTDTSSQGHLNFQGSQGPYFEELFFHLPFLIAHYLNASQKFADADYWYRRIFDPTASENPEPTNKTDRNWRYIEFRNRKVPKLQEILVDENAIERYKEDPFNPFAIARLRTVAFQKAVVMKYIDNLLDWGDHLFAQDTFESINEATILYIMAADILGKRPEEIGDCETTSEFLLSYQNILSHKRTGSEFLLELENLFVVQAFFIPSALEALDIDGANTGINTASFNGFLALREKSSGLQPYQMVKSSMKKAMPKPAALPKKIKTATKASVDTTVHRSLAFCVPFNENLLGYWDRVEDRLFKIRNCMNLQGVRRELALFQPPIDPGLLIKAKAAGLSLEDVLGLLTAELPAYRFTYLLEKAKQFVGTVQNFGNSLLSALENKDTEDLTLLRSVHEQELLKAVREVKEKNETEALESRQALEKGKAQATKRKDYYSNLTTGAVDPELAIDKNEQDSLNKQEDAKENEGKSSKREQGASGINAAPFIGFTYHPFAVKLPFNPMSQTGVKTELFPLTISYSTANVASTLSASATKFRRESSFKNIESNRAATRAGHERRKQEWQHQEALAKGEEDQFDKQLLAADARIGLAEKDLAAHDQQIEQAKELHEFYKGKFTSLGLYTYLATSLSRLYREAYNLAHDMAMKAQRAYQFETDDQTFFIGNDNWQGDKAGFLAGERLILQLQRMEKAYLEQTRREYEINISCSLVQIDPRALIDLRETGRCDFSIPEIWFDLYYPGQYKRRIKSVRLTIPCVAGPYTNVSAKLTLIGSRIRAQPQLNTEPVGIPYQRNTSVATSSANNDAGVFELNFRDERYLPFEGAGAISDWHLELPSVFRPFDYNSISDVVLHISYTAKEDGRFKEEVEADLVNRFEDLASENGLTRWFSMKREFGSALHRFKHPLEGLMPTTEIRLDHRHFPHYFRNREIRIEQFILVLKLNDNANLNLDSFDLIINNVEGSNWTMFPDNESQLPAKTFALNAPISATGNTFTISANQLEITAIDDIWILINYRI